MTLGASGCSIVFGEILPTPGHRETVRIDPSVGNAALMQTTLATLRETVLVRCPRAEATDFDCEFAYWQRTVTRTSPKEGLIEIGDFPTYMTRIAGHTARIARAGPRTLAITVKGRGPYYTALPNEAQARKLADLLDRALN